jgi:hypothetical protein
MSFYQGAALAVAYTQSKALSRNRKAISKIDSQNARKVRFQMKTRVPERELVYIDQSSVQAQSRYKFLANTQLTSSVITYSRLSNLSFAVAL